MTILASTRFNDYTWNENVVYRKRHKIKGIYPVLQRISHNINPDELLFIVEMNNSQNKIEGIGLIRNKIDADNYYKVYDFHNFNRYTYKTDYRIDRFELETYNKKLVEVFDYILFREKTHLKRGCGITCIPEKLLRHNKCDGLDLLNEVKNIFISHFGVDSKTL